MLIDKGFTDTILSELISILNCIILYIIVDATHINKNSFRQSIICQVWKGLENREVKNQGPRNAAGCPDTGRPQEGSTNSDHPRLPFTRGLSLISIPPSPLPLPYFPSLHFPELHNFLITGNDHLLSVVSIKAMSVTYYSANVYQMPLRWQLITQGWVKGVNKPVRERDPKANH